LPFLGTEPDSAKEMKEQGSKDHSWLQLKNSIDGVAPTASTS